MSLNYFSNALGLFLYMQLNILFVRFDTMVKKRLISSYDEKNDTFVGKIDGENGFCADYGISEGVFLTIDKNNLPASIFVSNASEVFEIPKQILEDSDVKISIDCDSILLKLKLCIRDLKICSITCKNKYGIPNVKLLMDSNY